jgi:hypothetical protein
MSYFASTYCDSTLRCVPTRLDIVALRLFAKIGDDLLAQFGPIDEFFQTM